MCTKNAHLPVGMAAVCLGLDGMQGTSAVCIREQCCGAAERGMWDAAGGFFLSKSPGTT